MRLHLVLPPLTLALLVAGCAATASLPAPADVALPASIADGTGAFVSPYRADGSLARWAARALDDDAAQRGSGLSSVPAGRGRAAERDFFGGTTGDRAASAVVIDRAGGWTNIRGTSDLSFASADELAAYLYARHSADAGYDDVRDLVFAIYPDVRRRYRGALERAAAAAAPAAK